MPKNVTHWLSFDLDTTTKIKKALHCKFQKYGYKLSFRVNNTSETDACWEFLQRA